MTKMTGYNLRKAVAKSLEVAVAATFSLTLIVGVLPSIGVHAAANELGERSLTVTSSANGSTNTDIGGTPETAGQGGNGEQTGESIQFTIPVTGNVGAMSFVYCTTPLPGTVCTTPTGLSTANVTSIAAQKVNGAAPSPVFSLDTTTTNTAFNTAAGLTTGGCNGTGGVATRTNCLLIKRASTASQTANDVVLVTLGGTSGSYITNPTTDNTSFFVRITLFSDTGYTTTVDQGTVASSTAQQVDVTAKVQETLNFSVGTYDSGASSPDSPTAPGSSCTALGGTGESSGLTLGNTAGGAGGVLSATQAYDAHSYFRLSTNAFNGAVVQYSGGTLQSGSNSIAAATTTKESSAVGSAQFGIALDSSDTQAGSGYSMTNLSPATNYSSGNGTIINGGTAQFAYDPTSVATPVTIASSTSIVICDTGSVRYLGNIAYSTPAGIYTTNISYLVVPTY